MASVWSSPANLSRSGAASQPRLFALPGGGLQAFWIDRFDGMMTAIFNGETWSLPVQALPLTLRLDVESNPIPYMPELVVDNSGKLHAFIYSDKKKENGEFPLLYSQLILGTSAWQPFIELTESALFYRAFFASDNELKLVYLRPLKSAPSRTSLETEPGLFIRSSNNRITGWSPPVQIQSSIYYRILTSSNTYLETATAGNVISLVWNEPRLGRLVTADSLDLGKTWSEPQELSIFGGQPASPILTRDAQDNLLRIWQDAAQPGCVLYQQKFILPTQPTAGTTTNSDSLSNWSAPERILESINNCPTGNHFFISNETLYWLWGETTNALSMSVWDNQQARWSQPQTFNFSFEDSDTGRFVQLGDLHAALDGETLAVSGIDGDSGEMWTLSAPLNALEVAFAEPSPWAFPTQISNAEQQASNPALSVDSQGRPRLVWSQGTSLYYARFSETTAQSPSDILSIPQVTPVEIIRAASGEVASQPALLATENDILHLTWIGGSNGDLLYSRALVREAGSASGWLPANATAPSNPNAAWPQIASDAAGRLYILYVIPLNEQRGVYLVVSENNGETWSQPEQLFDAIEEGWPMVAHPSFLIDPDGVLHVAFTKSLISGALPSEGIYYMRTKNTFLKPEERSGDPSQAWTEPVRLEGAGADWPSLAYLSGQLHLLYNSPRGIQQRWLPISEQTPTGLGWASASRIPGWQSVEAAIAQSYRSSDQRPYTIAADARNLHLLATLPGSPNLNYSVWTVSETDPTAGRWNQVEIFTPLGRWNNTFGITAAIPLTGGRISIAWLAQPEAVSGAAVQLPSIYFSQRIAPTVTAPTTALAIPTSTPTPEPTIEPTPIPIPTATLSPNLPPPPSEETPSPLILGGGLAAFIVVLIFAGILLRGKR